VRELEDTIATLTRERDEARQRANEQEAEKEMESHAADVWEMDCKKAESDRDAWKAKAELPPQPDDVGAVLREANVLLAVAQHYGSKKWLEDVVTLRLKIKAHLTAVLNAEMVALHTQLGAEDEESVLDAVLRLQRSREDDTVLLGTVAAERDAAFAERDAARHMLTAYGCRDAAGHNDDDCPLCSAEHALLNTRESLTEARRVLREVEWEASARICPICASAKRHGHLPDCRLKAALEGQ